MEIFISILSAMVVSAITAVITFLLTKRLQDDQSSRAESVQESLQHTIWTLKLWEEHESRDMMTLRRAAGAVARKYFDRHQEPLEKYRNSKTSVYEWLRTSSNKEEREDFNTIHQVAHFYERTAIQFNFKLLDDDLFFATLAPRFMDNYRKVLFPFIKDIKANEDDKQHWIEPLEKFCRYLDKKQRIR
ncbi:MAG: hypothetical protein AAF716_21900 [Cyanobacteria bacterium P01_D01_bin.1]